MTFRKRCLCMKQPKETKNEGNQKMNANILWISQAVIVTAGCFTSNLDGAWMGHPAKTTQFLITAAYIIFWGSFTFSTRSKPAMAWISVVMSAFTFIGAATSLMMRLLHSGFIFAAILSTFASVPFYGLRFLMDWTPLYAIVSIISLLWLIYSLRNLHVVRKSR